MKLQYKGYFISCHPLRSVDNYWQLEIERNDIVHTHIIENTKTFKEVENFAFDKIDLYSEANIQRVDAQVKKYWGKK
jgi:hypothetical protein